MPIIPDIQTAKKVLQVNYINSDASLPPMRKAETELRKVLGKDLFTEVQGSITAGDDNELNQLCQECVALYAYWLHLPDLMVQIGETGLQVASTEANPQPFKWQYREKRDALSNKYFVALDDLITYLLEEKPAAWQMPALYSGRVFSTGAEFSKYYTLKNPEAVFLQLLPIIAEVEETYVSPVIGKAFFEGFDKTSDDPINALMRRAVANFTIKEAANKITCQLSADGFTVLMDPPDDPRSGRKNAPLPQVNNTAYAAEKAGEKFINELKDYLNKNAAATGPYAAYFSSPYYTKPNTQTTSPNAKLQGIFML